MTAKCNVFEADVSVLETKATQILDPGLQDRFRFSGRLRSAINAWNWFLDGTHAVWVHVATRKGNVRVLVPYDEPNPDQEFIVRPGFPLHFLTRQKPVGSSDPITVEPVGSFADVEVEVYRSEYPVAAAANEWLVLNAGTGVTANTFTRRVGAWKDTRVNTIAGLDFIASSFSSGEQALLIDEDPDFNGKPSVEFDSIAGGTRYGYIGSAFDWLTASDSWTYFAVLKPYDIVRGDYTLGDKGLWSNDNGSYGSRVDVDGAFRLRFTDRRSGAATDEVRENDEFIEKPSVLIIHHKYISGSGNREINIYWQGQWRKSVVNASALTPVAPGTLYIGAHGTSNPFRGKIADMRWLTREATLGEINDYIEEAKSEYGVTDTSEQGYPLLAPATSFHRANRGYTGSGANWYDTRAFMTYGTLNTTQSAPVADFRFADEPAFQFNGASDQMNWGVLPHLGGGMGLGFTLAMVCWFQRGDLVNHYALLAQGSYDSATLSGTNVFLEHGTSTAISYETENGSNADIVNDPGNWSTNPVTEGIPYLILYEYETSSKAFRIEEINLTTGDSTYLNNGVGVAAGVSAAAAAYLYRLVEGANTRYTKGGLAEITTMSRVLTADERTQLKAYVSRRYT